MKVLQLGRWEQPCRKIFPKESRFVWFFRSATVSVVVVITTAQFHASYFIHHQNHLSINNRNNTFAGSKSVVSFTSKDLFKVIGKKKTTFYGYFWIYPDITLNLASNIEWDIFSALQVHCNSSQDISQPRSTVTNLMTFHNL